MRKDKRRNHTNARLTSDSRNRGRLNIFPSVGTCTGDGVRKPRTVKRILGNLCADNRVPSSSKQLRTDAVLSVSASGYSFDGMIPKEDPGRKEKQLFSRGGTKTKNDPIIGQVVSLPLNETDRQVRVDHGRIVGYDGQDGCLLMDSQSVGNEEDDGPVERTRENEIGMVGTGTESVDHHVSTEFLNITPDVDASAGKFQSVEITAENEVMDSEDSDVGDSMVNNSNSLMHISRRLEVVLSWERLVGIVCITGATKFSAIQYKILALALRTANPTVRMFTYKTLRRTMRTVLSKHCYPQSSLMDVVRRAPVHVTGVQALPTPGKVRIVLPSDWAKIDVATYTFYSDVFENPGRNRLDFISIEDSPLVQRRSISIGKELCLWASYQGTASPTNLGDCIKIPCSHGQGLNVSQLGWPVQPRDEGSGVTVRGIVGPMWCVRTDSSAFVPDIEFEFNTVESVLYSLLKFSSIGSKSAPNGRKASNADLRRRLSKNVAFKKSCAVPVICAPGDVIVIIRPCTDVAYFTDQPVGQHVCLMIGSALRLSCELSAERLVWLRVNEESPDEPRSFSEVTSVNVMELPTFVSGGQRHPQRASNPSRPNKGFLDNGERFVVYRVALYTDGFKQLKSLSDLRSVGGCYMLPLGLSVECRRSRSAVRVITVAPHGESLNDVMHMIMQNIVESAVKGVTGIDPYGRKVRIFLDPVGFFGDFPALTALSNVLGHTADACCTLCFFSRRKKTTDAEILYSVEIHSRRLGYMRFDDRMDALLRFQLDTTSKKALGVRYVDETDAMSVPGVSLSKKIREMCNDVPLYQGRPVVDPTFDSAMSTAVAPDHMFTGLIKNLLTLCFSTLSFEEQRTAEIQILDNLKSNGLPFSGYLLKKDKDGKINGLHSLTMSELFCILLCADPVFYSMYVKRKISLYMMPRKLQRFVASTYRWRTVKTDGTDNSQRRGMSTQDLYQSEMSACCKEYLKGAADMCKFYGDRGRILDKPNAHRALELCFHTVPNYGHARNCSEMVLELMHRTFKDWLEANTNDDSHLTAVERALGRDWLGRIHSLYQCYTSGSKQERDCAERGLLRLICGNEVAELDENEFEVANMLERFRDLLKNALREPVLTQMQFNGYDIVAWDTTASWETLQENKQSDKSEFMTDAVLLLAKEYNIGESDVLTNFKFFNSMRYAVHSKFGKMKRTYMHNTVHIGDGISAICESNGRRMNTVHSSESGRGEQSIWIILLIIEGNDGKIWTIVKNMISCGDVYTCKDAAVQLLSISNSVRRIALMHDCGEKCQFNFSTNNVSHHADAKSGGYYYVYNRCNGYPPHMG